MNNLDSHAAQHTHAAMGTVMAHRAFGVQAEACLAAVEGEIERLEGELSRFIPESDVSRVNRSAGIQPEYVSPDTFEVLSLALEISSRWPDCFAVTIGPLVRLWSLHKQAASVPGEDELLVALMLVDDRLLALDVWNQTAMLERAGQSIDLGGIGKGHAGDRILEVYRQYGITSAFSNLGGNVVTLGGKPDGSPWQIGIQHPREADRLIGSVAVVGESVVTSGDYQRYYTDRAGIRRHHLLDPVRGYPADSGLLSVTVVAAQSALADALSTVLFVAGPERGAGVLKQYPGVEAIWVDKSMDITITPGLQGRFRAGEGVRVTIVH